MKDIALVFCSLFLVAFLLIPTTIYEPSTPDCPERLGSELYENCESYHTAQFGTIFGGVQYIIASFKKGNFSMEETAIKQDTSLEGAELFVSNANESYESFKPKAAIFKAGLSSFIITTIAFQS